MENHKSPRIIFGFDLAGHDCHHRIQFVAEEFLGIFPFELHTSHGLTITGFDVVDPLFDDQAVNVIIGFDDIPIASVIRSSLFTVRIGKQDLGKLVITLPVLPFFSTYFLVYVTGRSLVGSSYFSEIG